jgi:RND family efflux transporter MFP subunit
MSETGDKNRLRPFVLVALVTAVVTAATVIGINSMRSGHPSPAPGAPVAKTAGHTSGGAAAGSAPDGGQRRIAYWRAPMNPTEIYDKPGKSAMGMDLVPVYEDSPDKGAGVTVDPVTQQNMGIRTAAVENGPLVYTIRTYGHITYDETRTVDVSPKTSGWIEHIHVNFEGKPVRQGEPLYEIYSPELVTAQEEYLTTFRNLQRMGAPGRGMLTSARQRLRYFDIADDEIDALEHLGRAQKTLTIRSPFSGIVIEKNVSEGSFVKAGSLIYRISDLSTVWVEAHIFEYELPWVATGQKAVMTLPYEPGKTYTGTVAYVYPYLQAKTRDVVIRIEVKNADRVLKPNMYADVSIESDSHKTGLIVPTEAVLRSGARNVVFVPRGDNKFSPRQVTLGVALDGRKVQVLAGLLPTDTVVTSGQFLLDSESTLQEAIQKMRDAKTTPPPKQAGADDFFKDMN